MASLANGSKNNAATMYQLSQISILSNQSSNSHSIPSQLPKFSQKLA